MTNTTTTTTTPTMHEAARILTALVDQGMTPNQIRDDHGIWFDEMDVLAMAITWRAAENRTQFLTTFANWAPPAGR